jgi:hypothetical protein
MPNANEAQWSRLKLDTSDRVATIDSVSLSLRRFNVQTLKAAVDKNGAALSGKGFARRRGCGQQVTQHQAAGVLAKAEPIQAAAHAAAQEAARDRGHARSPSPIGQNAKWPLPLLYTG